MENPDWWSPNGHVPPLDPKNELGSAWMPIFNDELPISAGFGIHGTNSPQTVGTRCSNGCVRLLNEQASELFWWVRTGSAGGEATQVFIR
jgi:lipoprotein-anchoring transpeptidase ErfK/SrfK